MNSRFTLLTGSLALLAVIDAAVVLPVVAHEGHAKVGTQSFDINAPRAVSPEAAGLIGLQTAEVDFGVVVSLLRIGGIVRAQPDRVQAVAPRVAGSIQSIYARVGDRVSKGKALVEVASPDYLKLLAEIVQSEGTLSQLHVEADSNRDRVAEKCLAVLPSPNLGAARGRQQDTHKERPRLPRIRFPDRQKPEQYERRDDRQWDRECEEQKEKDAR